MIKSDSKSLAKYFYFKNAVILNLLFIKEYWKQINHSFLININQHKC